MLTWTLVGLYCALTAVWALLTLGLWWRRRCATPDLAGDAPQLDPYELVRLARGRYGQIEVMMAHLLESGVLVRGPLWGEPESRVWTQNRTYRLAIGGAPALDAHQLERRFVAATERAPDANALYNASEVTEGDVCERIEARLVAEGLLYDESRRWRIAGFGWALFSIGLAWAIGRLIARDGPADAVTDVLFLASTWMFLPNLVSMPDRPDPTPNGRLVFERAQARHGALRGPVAPSDIRLAVALFGADIVDETGRANSGVRDTYELLDAEAQRFVGL